ncbi:Golgi reassembly-stacking protein 2 [Chrysoperla carnea]|uniref:Golgi reassembly-stacking protein 2 n=1 Tax=Chrysoperla carnea TaxID=189513 RepID=UPI001D06C067|nr:Golgi reassembly-stacking protein 2 [Chrysoperla carnea]
MGGSNSVPVPGGGTEAYHVLRVQNNSPGHHAGLEAFFDFIVAIGTTRLDQDNETLKELLRANIDKEIKMTVYSSKTQQIREVLITPSNSWGGQGLLGISIKFCSFEGANENVWHVLEVYPSSPAGIAGLRPHTDYIIGADSVLHESEDLFTLIEAHEGRALKLYVYNIQDDSCREVTITPNLSWGGEGSLGCGIGYGYLHRIPVRRELPNPGSTIKSMTSNLATNDTNPTSVGGTAHLFNQQTINTTPQQPAQGTVSELFGSLPPPIIIPSVPVGAYAPPPTINSNPNSPYSSSTPVNPALPTPLIPTNTESINNATSNPVQVLPTSYSQNIYSPAPGAQQVSSDILTHTSHNNFMPVQYSVPSSQPFVSTSPSTFMPSSQPMQPILTPASYPPPPMSHQLPSGVPLTTPISLPGLPPITVSATLPPNTFEGLQTSNNQTVLPPPVSSVQQSHSQSNLPPVSAQY